MADNINIDQSTQPASIPIAADDIGGVLHQRAKIEFGEDGSATDVSTTNPLPVVAAGASTETTLAALKASIDALSAKIAACDTGAVALDAATLSALESINAAISGPVAISNFPAPQGLTDAELRAVPLQVEVSSAQESAPFSGVTNEQLRCEPLIVAFDLEDELQLLIDQKQTTVIGGKTRQGNALPQVADEQGAQILSDAPVQITGAAFSTAGKGSILCSFDTQGYQSISLHVFGTWAGTLTFYISNTGQDWQPITGYLAASGVAPVSSTTGNGVWVFPSIGRYFKAQMTSYTSGTATCAAFLRNQPMPVLEATANRNIAQLGGYALVQPGAVSAMPPLAVGGGDATGRMRRFTSDLAGNQMVVGGTPDQAAPPLVVRPIQSNQSEDGIGDALNQIVRELRYHSFILSQLPLYLNSGLSLVDEVEPFRDDPTLGIN